MPTLLDERIVNGRKWKCILANVWPQPSFPLKIEFLTTEFEPEPHVVAMTEELFTRAALSIGLPISQLSLVLVGDDARYGEAVDRVHPGAGYTNHPSGYRGMAKTAPIRESDGTQSSAIVIYLNALGGALTAVFPEGAVHRNPLFEESCTYLVYHELGHCLDNVKRANRSSPPAVRQGQGFEISQFALYHADILEEEYAASAFAAAWMTGSVYNELFSLMRSQLDIGRADAVKLQLEYSRDSTKLTLLASSVAGWCWSLLMQFAKMAGSRHVNTALAEVSPIWPEEDEVIVGVFEEFDLDLLRHWRIYPVWPDPPPFMRETWETLAFMEGFKFVEDARGSAVYWDE